MDPQVTRKEFVRALMDVLSLAISHDHLDDAEALLAAMRALRPAHHELDAFEAWLAMKRLAWADAIRILRSLEATRPQFQVGRAFLAMCLYAVGDAQWRSTATDVVETASDANAVALARDLLEPDGEGTGEGEGEAEADPSAGPAGALRPAGVALDAAQRAFALRV